VAIHGASGAFGIVQTKIELPAFGSIPAKLNVQAFQVVLTKTEKFGLCEILRQNS
jgi:hypothetical protein